MPLEISDYTTATRQLSEFITAWFYSLYTFVGSCRTEQCQRAVLNACRISLVMTCLTKVCSIPLVVCLTDLKQTPGHCAGNTVPKIDVILSSYKFVDGGEDLERLKAHLSKINAQVLAFACMRATQCSDIPRLALIAIGGFNAVFRADFSSTGSKTVIVRVPLTLTPSTSIVASSVATMSYARFILNVPCPMVLAWNDSIDNLVGLPYIIMEICAGVRLDSVWGSIPARHQIRILWKLAEYFVQMTAKQPFQKYGRLYFDSSHLEKSLEDLESYVVGDYPSSTPRRTDETFVDFTVHASTDLQVMWVEAYTARLNAMKERWKPDSIESDKIHDPSWIIQTRLSGCQISTWGEAMSVADDLDTIIQGFDIPPALRQACLVPTDFAFRNVMYDPAKERITGFLDWDDAAILPAVLIPHCPQDLNDGPTPMADGGPSSLPEKLVGDWSSFEDKPRGWYKSLEDHERLVEFTGQLSDLETAINGNADIRFQLIFVEFLRLWDFPKYHSSSEDGILSAPSLCCVDAQKIHRLVQGGFLSWCLDRRWLSAKAREIQKPMWVLKLSQIRLVHVSLTVNDPKCCWSFKLVPYQVSGRYYGHSSSCVGFTTWTYLSMASIICMPVLRRALLLNGVPVDRSTVDNIW